MHLLRVQIPKYRVLKNVDITFEKEFTPRTFPLGSQNGGGKSTFLQLIFILLHCSSNEKRFPYLQNILQHFQKDDDTSLETLAIFDIWDGEKVIKLEFLVCDDRFIQETHGQDENHGEEISLSVSTKLKDISAKLSETEKKIKNQPQHQPQRQQQRQPQHPQQRQPQHQPQRQPQRQPQQQAQQQALQEIENLKNQQSKLSSALEKIHNIFSSKQLQHITNYSSNGKNDNELAVLCRIESMDANEVKPFLDKLSRHIFLMAPVTQIYLFLPPSIRKNLFHNVKFAHSNHQQELNNSKKILTNFSIYDPFSIDTIMQFFEYARDKDFAQAVETGKYGNKYPTLLRHINSLLYAKSVKPESDLSGIYFELDNGNGGETRLYPEDLSHGELKQLTMFAWLKANEIENAIVLMDEVEIALHPDWQYQVIIDLNEWAPSNQYILATHSYELCRAVTPAHVKDLPPPLIQRENNHGIE